MTHYISPWSSTYKWYVLSHLHGEVLHTNESLYIQRKVLHTWTYTNEHTNGSFTYQWQVLHTKDIQMRYKWDTNDTLSIAWWICYTGNHSSFHPRKGTCQLHVPSMGCDQCQNLQLFLFSIKIICMVKFYIQLTHYLSFASWSSTYKWYSLICMVRFYIQNY